MSASWSLWENLMWYPAIFVSKSKIILYRNCGYASTSHILFSSVDGRGAPVVFYSLYQWMKKMPLKTKQNRGLQSVLCLRNQILDNNLITGQLIWLAPTQIHSFLKWPTNFRWCSTNRTLTCQIIFFSLFFLPLSWGKFGFLPVFVFVFVENGYFLLKQTSW